MTRKGQNKILDAKIESNVNQYKADRMNAEISAFSSGDLNKYEFLTRKDLKYDPNALDKARFEFSPLGQTFSIGLGKTAQGYQEEGVMKLLKDIRDSLRVGVRPPRPDNDNDNDNNDNDNDNDDNNDNNDTDDDNDDDNDDDDDDEKISEHQEVVSPLLEEINKKYTNYDDEEEEEDIPDLETEEEAAKRMVDDYDDIIKSLKD